MKNNIATLLNLTSIKVSLGKLHCSNLLALSADQCPLPPAKDFSAMNNWLKSLSLAAIVINKFYSSKTMLHKN